MAFLRRVARDLWHLDRLVLVLLSILVVTPFGRLFATGAYLGLATGAALVALVVSVAVPTRRPFLITLLLALVALAAYEVFVVFHIGTPVLSDLGDVWSGVSSSVQSLRGTSLPAVSSPSLVTVPVLLAWAATLGGLGLAARTRFVALVLLPALGAYVVALLFTGTRPVEGPWVPLAILAASLAVVLVRANATDDDVDTAAATTSAVGAAPPRLPTWLKVGIPALVVANVLGVVAGVALPLVNDDQRTDVRETYQAPVDLSDATTPLALIPSGHTNMTDSSPDAFTVNLSYASPDHPKVDKIRIASLDAFDGAVWSTHARFTQIGTELPVGPTGSASTSSVTQAYVLDSGYRSPFLPALERATAVDQSLFDFQEAKLVFDRQAGMVVAPEGPKVGMRYTVTSAVPVLDEAAVKAAPSGNDAAFADLALPPANVPIPKAVATYAANPKFNAGTNYDSMRAVEKDMHDTFGYNTKTPLDASMAALDKFLAAPEPDKKVGRVGDSQQFASALALIARIRGLPSRVVVGYRISGDASTVGGEVKVKAKDIHAWAEVNFRGVGWVAFDGTNPDRPDTPDVPPETTTIAPPPTTRAPQQAAAAPGAPTAQQTCDVIANDCGEDITEIIWWPLYLLGLLVLIPVAIVAWKFVRRRRRRRGSPTERAMGAWRETMDRLRAHGVPTSNAITAAELASSSSDTVGEQAAVRLAEFTPVLDTVLYQQDPPDEALADSAWDAEAGVAEAIKKHYGPMARFRARIDPRPLLRRK